MPKFLNLAKLFCDANLLQQLRCVLFFFCALYVQHAGGLRWEAKKNVRLQIAALAANGHLSLVCARVCKRTSETTGHLFK
jgi:hypothetical protein